MAGRSHRSQRSSEAEQQQVGWDIVEVLEDRGGRSPLIIKDLDLYPQPPTNTHSPTLNSEEPLNHRNLAGTPAQGASITSTTTRP